MLYYLRESRPLAWERGYRMRVSHKIIVRAVLPVAVIFVPVQAAGLHKPTVLTGDCKFKKTAYVESDAENFTSSPSYINVTDGAVSFTQGGRTTGCIAVHFEAQSAGTGSEILYVRALLDGGPMFPADISFAGVDVVSSAHGFTWEGSATPGAHTVQMQYRSSDGKADVFIEPHVTTVQHQ